MRTASRVLSLARLVIGAGSRPQSFYQASGLCYNHTAAMSKEERKAQEAADEAAALSLFTSLGLDENTAKNASVNPKFRKTLTEIIHEAGATQGLPKSKGNLLYYAAGKFPANALVHRPTLLSYVLEEKIKSNAQMDGAFDYLKKLAAGSLNTAALEQSAGVGVEVTPEDIKAAVAALVEEHKARLLEDRYQVNPNILLGQITRTLKWADGAAVRAELESALLALLGPKTEADLKPVDKKKVAKPAKADSAKTAEAEVQPEAAAAPVAVVDPYADPEAFRKPQDNNHVHTEVPFSDGSVMRISNTPEQLAQHLKVTGGAVWTRFPPEPNGYLHIGHAKAMFVDFGFAEYAGGQCYLRYDDTNPEAEKQEYIQHIQEIVAWMGWKPWKVTYSSDYFQHLYDLAVQLIKSGHAFVCHQTKAEIEVSREQREPSPWRDRPIEESLRLFEDMRRGLFEEGQATLRMKMDHKNNNYNMFDLIAYRIKYVEHPHAGAKWCIYPSYDYTHCIVDSLENISHSLCTLEFETRRASYFWLLEVLGLYKPHVWEYSRLNITNTVMSKRKLNKLVTAGFVNGWDDPRLLTLSGLRRRGVTAAAINSFCREIGISRTENIIHMHKLEHLIRADLDATSPRVLAVLRPLKVVITNLEESHYEEVDAKLFPGRTDDIYKVPFTRVVFMEETDFRLQDNKDFYGLAPGKSIMLRYAYPVKYVGHSTDPSSGRVVEVQVEADLSPPGTKKPPKGVLNWVAQPRPGQEPLKLEARLYDVLFKSEEPGMVYERDAEGHVVARTKLEEPNAWLADLNPESLHTLTGCYGCPRLAQLKPGDRVQFERLGFFCVDPDTAPGRLVVNRTVTLKASVPLAVEQAKAQAVNGR
ncbi:tRNA synthetases class I, catalytic domain-containing protein [Haematococcus lacustris]